MDEYLRFKLTNEIAQQVICFGNRVGITKSGAICKNIVLRICMIITSWLDVDLDGGVI